jgi:hypothetical protein
MKYLLLIYNDPELLDALPKPEFDQRLAHCYEHARGLMASGQLLGSERLERPDTAATLRVRGDTSTVTDGPFEARDLNEAIRIAGDFPWARFGSIEIRPIAQSLPD